MNEQDIQLIADIASDAIHQKHNQLEHEVKPHHVVYVIEALEKFFKLKEKADAGNLRGRKIQGKVGKGGL